MDAVMRRYMDIIHKYALGQDPPQRKPLWMPGDPDVEEPSAQPEETTESNPNTNAAENGKRPADQGESPPKKKQKPLSKAAKKKEASNPNLTAMQAHLFHLLRPLVSQHHNVRDALARSRTGDIDAFENVLRLVEEAVKEGMMKYEEEHANDSISTSSSTAPVDEKDKKPEEDLDPYESSLATVARVKRPYWVCQPYVRPLPKEALEKGSMTVSKKERKRLEEEAERRKKEGEEEVKSLGLVPGGRVEEKVVSEEGGDKKADGEKEEVVEEPRDGMVCG